MMNKLSLEETLREQIDGLEAKLESEVIENLQHLGDLRFYEEVQMPELQKQLAEARADADHWKSECNALQRMVHEARAEIERLREAMKAIDAIGDEKGNASRIEALRCFSIARAALAAERGE